jgi:hypothetical protein
MRSNRLLGITATTTLATLAIAPRAHAQGAPAVASAAAAIAPAAAASDPRLRLAGVYRYTNDPRDAAALDAAADRATDGMSFFIRGIARGRLREGLHPQPTITLTFAGGTIAIETQRGRLQAPDTGATVTVRGHDGHPVRVSHRLVGDGIVQLLAADQMNCRTEYHLSADGRTLTMRVLVTTPQLPHPITYALVYRRQ